MQIHDMISKIKGITGFSVFAENGSLEVFVDGDSSHMVEVVSKALSDNGIKYTQSKYKKFKGCKFNISIVNVGTVWNTNWEFV